MPRILIVEKNWEIQALVAQRFSSGVSHATHGAIDVIYDKLRQVTYDLVIWELRTSKPKRSKDIELLSLLRKNSPRVAAIVIADEEGVRAGVAAKDKNCRYFRRPIDADKFFVAITTALQTRSGSQGAGERNSQAAEPDADQSTFRIRLGMTLEAAERELIKMTLAANGGNKKTTAQILGISRRALYNKLSRLGVISERVTNPHNREPGH